MSTHKHFNIIASVVTVCAVLLTVLFMNGEALGITMIVDEDAEGFEGTEYFTANDLDDAWDDTDATVITLNGTTATIDGYGAYTYEGHVIISNAGYYVISGTLSDGSVTVDAYQSSKVFIKLAGADITCSDDAAFRVNQAEKVFLTLAEGTENSFTSGAPYSSTALSDNAGGTVFSHDDLTVNGSGSLSVTASYKHGFDCNDALHITGGVITVSAPQDALHVNDSVRISGCDLTINAGDDAIHCDNEIIIAGGTVLIETCYEGLEAPEITIEDGDITIYPTDDGFNANGGTSMFGGFPGGGQTQTDTSETYTGTPFIHINGGNILIVNESARDADGLDSNGDIAITGGIVLVSLINSGTNSAIDYGSESGGTCTISGGTVIACGSYSMAEHFDETSEQCAILYNFSAGADAGTTFSLEQTDGTVLVSWDVPCSFSSVNVSCEALTLGETYVVVIGDSAEEISLEETSASYGDAASSMFGGAFNQGGGMRQRNTGNESGDMQQGGGFSGGGGGGHHGRGASDGTADTDAQDGMGTPPETPEGMEKGDMPQPPEGMENMGTPPEMPEGMESMGTPPEMPEGMEEGDMPQPPEGMENMGTPPDLAEKTEDTGIMKEQHQEATVMADTLQSSDGDTTAAGVELAASGMVLLAGMVLAAVYQRRKEIHAA